ncbi:proton-coupled folate transporter-like [Metopolophium dirhodum]|uniref:proton-coupled folate transporter-like n=1 Tax=Metopolophium dirhodum TaxID=44670 RepID=UPI00298F6FCA|nr:proton-coupled folate transporter-like [Metopolophium dirhodum]XP_060860614.1 proton-coupled folate transporter-like [Metopolophium dirhodum]XP_060860615.1 proton-coupled folate transporter-like [Metopolophium dirhodum]XP_060860616.1 proton-coupled folate transporter-like [Metopolophium dirhodum]
MYIRNPTEDLKRHGFSQEAYLIIATVFYTASLTVSSSFQNNLSSKRSCEPLIPFGECLVGVYESQHLVYSNTNILQYLISFAVALIAGAWSDSHGRRRKPLIFLPVIAQVLTDGLYFGNSYWNWYYYNYFIFQWIIPALYVGRNIFWIGVMSYVSENSTVKSRTLKHGIIIATYPISSLMGAGLVALLKIGIRYRDYDFLFLVPIFLNLIALLVINLLVKDTSDSCNRDIEWQRPNYVLKEFTDLFKDKLKSSAVVLAILIICQSILVTRIGCDYDLIMLYIKESFMWYNDEEVCFTVLKTMAIFVGIVFSVSVLSHCMKINDLLISISVCCFYIAAAVCYIFAGQFFQIFMITIIYLCHGTVVTIISSLTSKLVPIEQLGRLNSIQMCMNSLLTVGVVTAYQLAFYYIHYTKAGHLCLFTILYVGLTLPILSVFVILYSKYKHVMQNDTPTVKQDNIYVIS